MIGRICLDHFLLSFENTHILYFMHTPLLQPSAISTPS